MLSNNRYTTLNASMIALSVLLASCGGGSSGGVSVDASGEQAPIVDNTETTDNTQNGPATIDVSDASLVTEASKVSSGVNARSGQGFSFPSVTLQEGGMSMVIPGGALPTFAARRTVVSGSGQVIEFGDAVTLKYDMFAWSDGSLVESSNSFEEAHTVQGGVSDEFPIPEYLAKSLLGRKLGDTIQVVLPVGTADLPVYLDAEDAYVMLVELL